MNAPRWLNLDGTHNTRDVGGLPLTGGGTVRPGRLVRSDNLQHLTAADVAHLTHDLHLDTVIDLRTRGEVTHEGPTPLSDLEGVSVHHLSLFPEAVENEPEESDEPAVEITESDGVDTGAEEPVVLPWQEAAGEDRARASASKTYLRYLAERPDSVVSALRLVAHTNGASLIHCAAGKDRTGVVVALALSELGVDRDAIVADYVASGERVARVMAGLAASPTYARDVNLDDADRHRPRATTMVDLLSALDRLGGPSAWLRRHGWTGADADALRRSLT